MHLPFCPWLGLVNGLFYWFFSKETAFVHWFFSPTDFKFSISLISVITFNPCFLTLDLICSFYHFLRWKLWLSNLIFVLLTCQRRVLLPDMTSALSRPSVTPFAGWLSILAHERSQCHLEAVKDKMNSSQGMESFPLEALSGHHKPKRPHGDCHSTFLKLIPQHVHIFSIILKSV